MSKEAMKLALEALNSFPHRHLTPLVSDARTALREALAQPQQEPLAWANPNDLQNFDLKVRTNGGPLHTVPLYTSPPARKPLADEQVSAIWKAVPNQALYEAVMVFARAIEAAHNIKENT